MRTLGALEAGYADDHVPLALVVGAMGTLAAVRKLLPDELLARVAPATPEPDSRPSPDAFIALVLGAVATHECLLRLFGPTLALHRAGEPQAQSGGNPTPRFEGLLR